MLTPCLLLLALPSSSGAQAISVLYDTYLADMPGNSGRIIGHYFSYPDSRSDQYADPFDVPVGEGDFLLDAIVLQLRNPDGVGDQVVRLFADGDDAPGSVLESWVVPPGGLLSPQNVRLEPPEDLLLLEGATYWVGVAMSQNLTEARWMKAEGAVSEAWRYARTRFAQPVWLLPVFSTDALGLMRIEAVPEASSALGALFALGSTVLLGRRRASGGRPRSPS